jgi:SAM-dependent methyltransferase
MQAPKQVEEKGHWILNMDPRTEKPLRACAACGSNDADSLGTKNDLEILSCRRCSTVYTPYLPWFPSELWYETYYQDQNLEPPAFVQKRLDEIVSEFAAYRQTNRLLDIGCGAGNLLLAARKNGWEAQGLDVSPTAVKHVRELGFEVCHGELPGAQLPSAHFDVITAAELLEHLPDPRAELQEIARLLRPGGLFWTTTPHARGLAARVLGLKWRCISPPEHLQLFSAGGLKSLMLDVGFREIRLQTTGSNPIEIWNAARRKKPPVTTEQHYDRVLTGYQLNETLMKSRSRRALKNVLNGVLNVSRLGDSLKVFATK